MCIYSKLNSLSIELVVNKFKLNINFLNDQTLTTNHLTDNSLLLKFSVVRREGRGLLEKIK